MFAQTQVFCYNAAFLNQLLASCSTLPPTALLATTSIQLFNNPIIPTPHDQPGLYIPTIFSGYNPVTGKIAGTVNLASGGLGLLMSAEFIGAVVAPFTGDTVYGYWVSAGTEYVGAEAFAQPIPIGGPGDFIDLEVVLPQLFNQPAQ